MNFEFKITLMRHKRYFEKGMSLTSYLKYLIAFFGLASNDVFWTMFYGLSYGVFCYVFGFFFMTYKWYEAEFEVENRINRFVREMRLSLKK